MDARDIPKFGQLGNSRLKHADRCRIMIQVVRFTSDQRNGDVYLGHYAGIDATITDVRDLETTVAAVLEKADPIVRLTGRRSESPRPTTSSTRPGSSATVPR